MQDAAVCSHEFLGHLRHLFGLRHGCGLRNAFGGRAGRGDALLHHVLLHLLLATVHHAHVCDRTLKVLLDRALGHLRLLRVLNHCLYLLQTA
jgi:hypothetical protein